MDFDLSPKEREYQQQVRDFIRANLTPKVRYKLNYAGMLDTRSAARSSARSPTWDG